MVLARVVLEGLGDGDALLHELGGLFRLLNEEFHRLLHDLFAGQYQGQFEEALVVQDFCAPGLGTVTQGVVLTQGRVRRDEGQGGLDALPRHVEHTQDFHVLHGRA